MIFERLTLICKSVVWLPFRKVVKHFDTMRKSVKVPFLLSIFFIIYLTRITSTLAESEDECKKIEEKSASMRLRKYLFCEYESIYLSALDAKDGTNVTIGLAPRKFDFNEENGNLELFGWFILSWEDPHLKWDPELFESIRSIQIESYRIWEPQVVTFSGGNEDSNEYGLPYTQCYLTRRGLVICAPQMRHTIRCQTDFTQWPFDRQNCTLVMSTWLQSSQHIRFIERVNETMVMHILESAGEWTLTASRVVYDERKSFFSKNRETTAPRVTIHFILDRVHNQLKGRYITPAIIMVVMTLTTLWLDPRSIERLSIACVNLIIHLFCMQDLHWVLPHNGSTVPNLLLFYANSLVLAAITLVLTFVLGNLQGIKMEPPAWISSSTAAILRSKVGQILLLSMLDPKVAAKIEPDADDSGDLVSSNSKTTAWGYVTIMCGWISFLTFFFTYVIMFAVLIPNSSMRPPLAGVGYLYHLGTIAFGSLLIAIFRLIRYYLESMRHMRDSEPCCALAGLIFCCVIYLVEALERFLSFLNRNAYIVCAVHGEGLCKSAFNALSLIFRNAFQAIILNNVASWVLWLGKISIYALLGAIIT